MRYTTVPRAKDTPNRLAPPDVTLPQPKITIMAVPRNSATHPRTRGGGEVFEGDGTGIALAVPPPRAPDSSVMSLAHISEQESIE